MARTKQQNDMATRDRRARKILQKLAREMEVTFNRLLDGIEDGTVVIDGCELVEG